jgi:hypothetical protein
MRRGILLWVAAACCVLGVAAPANAATGLPGEQCDVTMTSETCTWSAGPATCDSVSQWDWAGTTQSSTTCTAAGAKAGTTTNSNESSRAGTYVDKTYWVQAAGVSASCSKFDASGYDAAPEQHRAGCTAGF